MGGHGLPHGFPHGCPHRFSEDVFLERLDFSPRFLICGTFNPLWPESNRAEWFYGRTGTNRFWEVLPRMFGEPDLRKAGPGEWKAFCRRQRIALTDLIAHVADADPRDAEDRQVLGSFSDQALLRRFEEIHWTNLPAIIRSCPGLEGVFLTRGASQGVWKGAWDPVREVCRERGIPCRPLLTPSGNARFQKGKTDGSLGDFIRERWMQVWREAGFSLPGR